ncbi:phosphoribosylaminoimidazole-succinocarboxamide synthase [Halogranum amylolyticum]|uniref:Phosphoribosylaminoimidazole-succinocarboxamide synthase n=1 Tax=Halogranum amylolyticum TaxID=660520 RepID=A0A1H8N5N0_9EURY|nr:phosphoribosylaminoimidazolesuccinocarboxamide synthase [Halogranum amylolyticum]SEO24935.1 phosphoribosylaminoimidazole-succinocarboxamide synthase [Halogranum amylolyticum]
MTSVKEFRIEEEPTADSLGRGSFVFTDDYSVFDWGTMPDQIPGKGASLCTMGAFNFELLDFNHIPTHYRGVVEDGEASTASTKSNGGPPRDGEVKDLGECRSAPTEMAIDLVQVPNLRYVDGGYDYDAFYEEIGNNYLIPLEIVFRNTVPVGSSLRKRGSPADYGLDADEWPDEPVDLPAPVVEFSTKFEEQDRYLSREEADELSGPASVDRLEELALAVNHIVTDRAERTGFVHEDGKIECCYHDGTIKVADVVGTFDENRFSYDGQQVSKEVVRQYYKREHPEWVDAVAAAKVDVADYDDVADWRELCEVDPEPLPDSVVAAVSNLYAAGANAYTEDEWFDAPAIDDAVDAVRDL